MPIDVQMPDGTIVTNVPEGIRKSDLMRRLTQKIEGMPPQPKETASFEEGFGRSFADTLMNNVLGLPDLVATGFAQLPSPLEIVRPLTNPGQPLSIQPRTAFEDVTGRKPPQMGERVLPIPAARDIRAGVEAATSDKTLSEAQEGQRRREQRLAQEAPIGTSAGGLVADGVSILLGRAPFVRAAARSSIERGAAEGAKIARTIPRDLQAKILRNLKKPFETTAVKKLARGAGRAAEAGVEGATLALLHRGDPVETGAYAAAAQAGGSTFLSLLPKTKTGIGLGIAGSALAVGSVLQLLKSATPGGRNRILESVESGFDHVVHAVALGLVAGTLGAGRIRGRTWEDFPVIVDAITTLPRAAVMSLIEDATNDNRVEPVINKLSQDPDYFGPQARRKLDRAMRDKRMSFGVSLDKLMKNRQFKTKFDNIFMAGNGKRIKGLVQPGNIDIHNRPVVQNKNGSISTVRSTSFNIDGREVLLPTVTDDGRILDERTQEGRREIIDTYRRTGKHLGMFDTPKNATAYAKRLHDQQEREYGR